MLRVFLLLLIANIAYAEEDTQDDMVYHLEQRVNELTNKTEQLTHKNALLQKQVDALSSDVEFRFKELEAKSKAVPAKGELAKKPADPKKAKVAFGKAYALLKEQKYKEAQLALEGFLQSYPNSEYSGSAYYWLGESFMLRKNYNKAAVNYIQSFTKFPKNSKADLSMLKLASALNSLDKKKEACSTLAKLKAKQDKLDSATQKLLQKEVVKSGCKK